MATQVAWGMALGTISCLSGVAGTMIVSKKDLRKENIESIVTKSSSLLSLSSISGSVAIQCVNTIVGKVSVSFPINALAAALGTFSADDFEGENEGKAFIAGSLSGTATASAILLTCGTGVFVAAGAISLGAITSYAVSKYIAN